MLIIHDIQTFNPPWQYSCLTLGVFDGMHLGHQALVANLHEHCEMDDSARVLVTYHPHPDLVLGKRIDHAGLEIFTYEEKLSLFQKFELDAVVFLPFTKKLARMHALKYLKRILIEKLKAKHIIIGYDQCFGRDRKGNYHLLKKFSTRYGYKVKQIQAVNSNNHLVSSSHIRKLIYNGMIEETNANLGHTYYISGTVIQGKSRGRTLGYPTANLTVKESKALLGRGVYFGSVQWGNSRFKAMVNIGHNPTFGHQQLIVEAHLLDFTGYLYGEKLKIYFHERLRDEIKFRNVEELKHQLDLDFKKTSRLALPQI